MPALTRPVVRRLNALPQLAACNALHRTRQSVTAAHDALVRAVMDRFDVLIAAPLVPEFPDGRYRADLLKDGQDVTDSMLVCAEYTHESGAIEVVAYFS